MAASDDDERSKVLIDRLLRRDAVAGHYGVFTHALCRRLERGASGTWGSCATRCARSRRSRRSRQTPQLVGNVRLALFENRAVERRARFTVRRLLEPDGRRSRWASGFAGLDEGAEIAVFAADTDDVRSAEALAHYTVTEVFDTRATWYSRRDLRPGAGGARLRALGRRARERLARWRRCAFRRAPSPSASPWRSRMAFRTFVEVVFVAFHEASDTGLADLELALDPANRIRVSGLLPDPSNGGANGGPDGMRTVADLEAAVEWIEEAVRLVMASGRSRTRSVPPGAARARRSRRQALPRPRLRTPLEALVPYADAFEHALRVRVATRWRRGRTSPTRSSTCPSRT